MSWECIKEKSNAPQSTLKAPPENPLDSTQLIQSKRDNPNTTQVTNWQVFKSMVAYGSSEFEMTFSPKSSSVENLETTKGDESMALSSVEESILDTIKPTLRRENIVHSTSEDISKSGNEGGHEEIKVVSSVEILKSQISSVKKSNDCSEMLTCTNGEVNENVRHFLDDICSEVVMKIRDENEPVITPNQFCSEESKEQTPEKKSKVSNQETSLSDPLSAALIPHGSMPSCDSTLIPLVSADSSVHLHAMTENNKSSDEISGEDMPCSTLHPCDALKVQIESLPKAKMAATQQKVKNSSHSQSADHGLRAAPATKLSSTDAKIDSKPRGGNRSTCEVGVQTLPRSISSPNDSGADCVLLVQKSVQTEVYPRKDFSTQTVGEGRLGTDTIRDMATSPIPSILDGYMSKYAYDKKISSESVCENKSTKCHDRVKGKLLDN